MLPSPYETLANALWLPRLLAKARLYNSGTLPEENLRPFCHPSATDGEFLKAFQLTKEDILQAAQLPDDQVAAWFLAQPHVTPETIATWNDTALNLGRPGYPLEKRFPIALKTIYANVAPLNPTSVFETIAGDESHPIPKP